MNRRRRFKAKGRRQLIARMMRLMGLNFRNAKQFLSEQARVKRIAETPLRPMMVGRIGRGSKDAVQNKNGSITLTVRRSSYDSYRALRQLERQLPKAARRLVTGEE